jgi:integrase
MTITAVQLPQHIKKDGTCNIVLRIIDGQKIKYVNTKQSVDPKYFKGGWVVRHPDSVFMNQEIERIRTSLSQTVTSETIIHILNKKQQLHKERDQAFMYEKIGHLIEHVRTVGDTPVSKITTDWVNSYITSRKGMKASTIKKELSRLSAATKCELFKEMSKELKAEDPNREKLTLEEIALLETTPLKGMTDVARDMFLFAYYTHGMRFENVATFNPQGKTITYRMNKGKKIREIELHPKLKVILDKYKGGKPYLFPVVKELKITPWNKKKIIGNANALVNVNLKRVAIICGIEKGLHFHMSRHSFATLALEKGASYATLKDALGHSKYQTTEMYLNSLSNKRINDEVNSLYD